MATTENIAIEVDTAPRAGNEWGAIVAGALAAGAISLILLVLGSGLGLSMVSPWAGVGAGAATVAVGTVIWLVVVQWLASGVGGYLTGRLRSRAEPSDEVFFRDTANGFLAWALATLFVAAFLASAVSAIVGTGSQVAATVASGAAEGAQPGAGAVGDPLGYFVDSLYRPASTAPAASISPSSGGQAADLRAETGRILANGMIASEFPDEDLTYLSNRISAETGLSAEAARARVDAVVQKMQALKTDAGAAADAARKAAAKLSLYIFLSLLVGAFIAATAAALGGQHRDDYPQATARRPL